MNFTAVYERVPGGYIGFIEEFPGTNAQGATLDVARENLRDAFELIIGMNRAFSREMINGKDVIREPF